ncbi:MAG: phosphoglucosamine mutase [Pyrinomonadaceae bacterium]|nr:phosphoglucosamine mutase [Pyrinomonadaceae bacterium]
MKKLFGTDGMRGEAGRFPLDVETIRTTGRSLARQLIEKATGAQPRIIVGRDTRESGFWIEEALIEGAREAGAVCESAGVITTPGVAFLTRTLKASAGIVISASHNPYRDNGIKIFTNTERKLDETTERRIEKDIYEATEKRSTGELSTSQAQARQSGGEIAGDADLRARYLDYLTDEVSANLRLDDLKLVVDCANGAATDYAPAVFERLGAQVIAINNRPDGRNINLDCGSLHLEHLQRCVVKEKADLGVAFDGDADRSLFVDRRGETVDGDATLWVLAGALAERNMLAGNTIVATVMSNIGLELAVKSRGWNLLRADVGDKYVLEKLIETNASLGGEQSGHIIFPRESLAGDGIRTALHLLRRVRETNHALHELVEGFVSYPQVLVNVRVKEKRPFDEVPSVRQAAQKTEEQLGGRGRLLLRYSGTESLARVMIEGEKKDEINRLANDLAGIIRGELGEA